MGAGVERGLAFSRSRAARREAGHVMTVFLRENQRDLEALLLLSKAAEWVTGSPCFRAKDSAGPRATPTSAGRERDADAHRPLRRYPHFRVFGDYLAGFDDFIGGRGRSCRSARRTAELQRRSPGERRAVHRERSTRPRARCAPSRSPSSSPRCTNRADVAGCQKCWTPCRGFSQTLGGGGRLGLARSRLAHAERLNARRDRASDPGVDLQIVWEPAAGTSAAACRRPTCSSPSITNRSRNPDRRSDRGRPETAVPLRKHERSRSGQPRRRSDTAGICNRGRRAGRSATAAADVPAAGVPDDLEDRLPDPTRGLFEHSALRHARGEIAPGREPAAAERLRESTQASSTSAAGDVGAIVHRGDELGDRLGAHRARGASIFSMHGATFPR